MEIESFDVALSDGRSVRVHDTGAGDALTVLWHHGSPQTGALLDPLVAAAHRRGIRLMSYARPSYGGSSPRPGRDVASAAGDVAQIADRLGIARLAVMGASGGGPHALACAALLPGRIVGAVSLAGLAPFTDDDQWYAGMVAPGGLRAAAEGRESRVEAADSSEFDPNSFTDLDWAMLGGRWSSLATDAGRANEAGPAGLIDDDLAFVAPWGFDVAQIETPVLLVHGGQDRVVPRAHSERLLLECRSGELWSRPRDGHISILNACAVAMDWLLDLS
jgi:pimeloyl-ACP methyl ester carboxylesterase